MTFALINPTSRDLLEHAGGEEHALHTVFWKERVTRGEVKFGCSCGRIFSVLATSAATAALRNVPE